MQHPEPPPEARTVEPEDASAPERGTCPRCGSTDVVQLVIGMPASADEFFGGPEGVRWVGCVHPGHDRECRACGAVWTAGRPDLGP